MSLFSFMKDVGEKLFSPMIGHASAAPASPAAAAGGQESQDVANGDTIKKYITSLGLNVSGLNVAYDSSTYTATITGTVADNETREKVLIAAGNVMNVAKVDDKMTVTAGSGVDSNFYTVHSGDTLSKISKEQYGDATKYNKIFDANKPMLKSADLIYPGQVLRIPA